MADETVRHPDAGGLTEAEINEALWHRIGVWADDPTLDNASAIEEYMAERVRVAVEPFKDLADDWGHARHVMGLSSHEPGSDGYCPACWVHELRALLPAEK